MIKTFEEMMIDIDNVGIGDIVEWITTGKDRSRSEIEKLLDAFLESTTKPKFHIWSGDWEAVKKFCPPISDGGADYSAYPIKSWPLYLPENKKKVCVDLGDCIVSVGNGDFEVYKK